MHLNGIEIGKYEWLRTCMCVGKVMKRIVFSQHAPNFTEIKTSVLGEAVFAILLVSLWNVRYTASHQFTSHSVFAHFNSKKFKKEVWVGKKKMLCLLKVLDDFLNIRNTRIEPEWTVNILNEFFRFWIQFYAKILLFVQPTWTLLIQ